jgi:hypothetical protein
VFVTVYDWLDGVNGPPAVPDEVRPPAGVTVIGPATFVALTVRLTGRVVFPVSLVVLVKVTVSV